MVGPWLFWLGPMIIGQLPYFSLAWHSFYIPGIAINSHEMIIGGVLGNKQVWSRVEGLREELDTLRLVGWSR